MNLNIFSIKTFKMSVTLCLCLLFSGIPNFARGESSAKFAAISLENKKVMILGDSITKAGTYVSYIEYYLQKQNPDKKYDIISIGLSSETVSGLSENDHPFPRPCVHERLERALDKIKPDIVAACYGMNDGIYHPQSSERMEAFQKGIYKLIEVCKGKGVKHVILNTPPPFDPLPVAKKLHKDDASNFGYKHPYFKYAGVLEDYSDWIMNLKLDSVSSVDFNTALTEYLKKKRKSDKAFKFSNDGVHPSGMGHLMMAQVFLKGIVSGIKFGELNAEYKKVHSDPLFRLVSDRRKLRSKGWLEYVGYTRGKTVRKDSIKDVQAKAADLQTIIEALKNK
ncbi:MAG: SGNH/GDSL hydrolase family protein [Planctomycetes bacterium]|nr:SGNH/GDSL hydrolase family protein [Planctomycetota bacterium]